VELNQFAGGVDTSAGASAPRTVYAPVNPSRPAPETIVIRSFETQAAAGTPEDPNHDNSSLEEPAPTSISTGGIYDAKVGDINGRPIIASRFLEDLMPRLNAISVEQPDLASWRREARPV